MLTEMCGCVCALCGCVDGEITMECTVIGARCSNRTIYLIMYKVIRRKQQQNVFFQAQNGRIQCFFLSSCILSVQRYSTRAEVSHYLRA